MDKWSKEKAYEWQKKLSWIRGFCYVPSCCVGRVEMWQSYNASEVHKVIDEEFKLANEWGFNAVRIIGILEIYIDEHDSFLNNLETIITLANKHNLKVMYTFGNDCVVQKHNYKWPVYGPQSFDLGYHSGRKNSPHVVMNEAGYNIIDEKEYEEKFYEMIKEIITIYKDDERILLWDLYNEPGNSLRNMKSYPYLKNAFEIARKINPSQPCAACCWSYDENHHPYKEIELYALEMSDVILYHCYENYEASKEVIRFLKEKYDRPLFNTEWLHRIWNNNIIDLFPLFRKENVGCFNWGLVTGKSQTREPWEWLFNEYDKGKGRDWDFSKWQHDLIRPNHRPYDYKEYDVIKRECSLADKLAKGK